MSNLLYNSDISADCGLDLLRPKTNYPEQGRALNRVTAPAMAIAVLDILLQLVLFVDAYSQQRGEIDVEDEGWYDNVWATETVSAQYVVVVVNSREERQSMLPVCG